MPLHIAGKAHSKPAFDLFPAADAAIVHEHEGLVGERMAVAVAEVAFSCGAHVGEDERGCGFGGDAREIYAVPCWNRGGEDAGREA